MKWKLLGLILLDCAMLQAAQRSATATADDASVVVIPIRAFQFNNGAPVTIKVGQRVIWVNEDKMQHTASGDGGEFDTGILQPGTASEPISLLKESPSDGFSYHCNVHDGMTGKIFVKGAVPPDPALHHETRSIHSMVVMGTAGLFLSHIALFNDDNHAYQVTLEADFDSPDARGAYQAYRKDHPDEFLQLDPEYFLLPELQKDRRSFKGTFKRDGDDSNVVPGLRDVQVNVIRIIEFQHFDPLAVYPDRLTYRLFGNAKEVFLTNEITEAPNFQHVVKVQGVPGFLDAQQIAANPVLTVPAKQLGRSQSTSMKTAAFNHSSHLVLSPPPGTLNAKAPLNPGEELEILLPGDPMPRKLTIASSIFFDVRILNK